MNEAVILKRSSKGDGQNKNNIKKNIKRGDL